MGPDEVTVNTNPWYQLLDKVVWTYIEAFLALLVISEQMGISGYKALAIASIPAALTVAMNATAAATLPANLPFGVDLLLRAGRTYVAAFLGFLIATQPFDLSWAVWQTAAYAAIPPALALIKAAAARRVGNPNTASLLPLARDV